MRALFLSCKQHLHAWCSYDLFSVHSGRGLRESKKGREGRTKVEDKKIKDQRQQIENSKNMVDINATISVITLNINGLNPTRERHKL